MKLKLVALLCGLCSLVVLSGCGKDLKVSLKPSEAEKNGTSASLARHVEVSYHDPRGHEQVRESVPVLGLSQPMSMREDLLKDVKVEKGGLFEARAYSGDGLLLLKGQSVADPDEADGVEIVLDRQSERASELASPLLRRIRVANAPRGGEYVRDAGDLRKEVDQRRCLELPPLDLSSGAGTSPRIILEAAVKAPSFTIEVGLGFGKEPVKFQSQRHQTQVNSAGDAELELGRRFLEGLLLKKAAHLILRIHSDRYEGCLELKTQPLFEPVTAHFLLGDGAGQEQNWRAMRAVGVLAIHNPNSMPVFVNVQGQVLTADGARRLKACHLSVRGPVQVYAFSPCDGVIRVLHEVPAGGQLDVAVFGGTNDDNSGLVTRGLQTHWTVLTGVDRQEQALATPVGVGLIP